MRMLEFLSSLAWSAVMPLLLGTGIWVSVKLRNMPLRMLPKAIRWSFQPGGDTPGLSPFACLCTSLAATVGSGNIVGVAFALTAGGPGALVWMLLAAALTTALKYAECALAVRYRRRDREGNWLGGPPITLRGLPWKRLGAALGGAYALVEIVATLSANNMVQSSAISSALGALTPLSPALSAILIGVLTWLVISGGARGIARFSSALVPAMLALYTVGGAAVLVTHAADIPNALAELLRCAFDLRSVGAGAFGNMVRIGVAKGCFTNEAGTGTAGFSAAPTTETALRQGLISATANLWDTGFGCTVTALAVLLSGEMSSGKTGVQLVMAAYETGLGPVGSWIVGVCLVLFAFSSLPGLAFQGEMALASFTHSRTVKTLYRIAFSTVAAFGSLMVTQQALLWSDVFNAALIVFNLISIWFLPLPEGKPFDRKRQKDYTCLETR